MRKIIKPGVSRGNYDVLRPVAVQLGHGVAHREEKIGHVHRNNSGSSYTAYPLQGAEIGTWATKALAAEAVALWSAQVRL